MLYHYTLVISKPVHSSLFSRISHDEHRSQGHGASSLMAIMTDVSGQAIVARPLPSIVLISFDLQVAISDVEAISIGGMQPMGDVGEEGGGRVVGGGGGDGW
ncbi:hypothetical protein ARMGADRAFT_1169827 [Armillaria gallica]|uniref:Uncharacterized protein n=1 Tax=Armillaria gallica TaxID=47427 RepID=A0A2H3CP85_ARMGA|nr:hypothetical protein ARMGADRAFT_1169827 [Armillaria gallica]